jgi:hypothetical protein
MRLSHLKSAKLCKEEIIALRLYTGPMYIKYNAVLRGYPQSELRALKGNRYTTTIHAVVSGLLKLQKVTIVPSTHKVCRSHFSPWPGDHRQRRMLQTMLMLMTMHASWTCWAVDSLDMTIYASKALNLGARYHVHHAASPNSNL